MLNVDARLPLLVVTWFYKRKSRSKWFWMKRNNPHICKIELIEKNCFRRGFFRPTTLWLLFHVSINWGLSETHSQAVSFSMHAKTYSYISANFKWCWTNIFSLQIVSLYFNMQTFTDNVLLGFNFLVPSLAIWILISMCVLNVNYAPRAVEEITLKRYTHMEKWLYKSENKFHLCTLSFGSDNFYLCVGEAAKNSHKYIISSSIQPFLSMILVLVSILQIK